MINSFIFSAATGWFVINNYEYTKPLAYPQVFNEYTAIEPQIFNTMRISNLSDFAMEIDGPYPDGQRQIFYTATYAPDYSMLYQLFQLSNSSLQAVVNVVGISWSLVLQPIVPEMTKFGAQTGGNALGLDPSEGSLVGEFPLLPSTLITSISYSTRSLIHASCAPLHNLVQPWR